MPRLMTLFLLGLSLAACGPAIKVVEKPVPVKVTPCHLGPPPGLPDVTFVRCSLDAEGNMPAACTSPQELYQLGAWVEAMGKWVKSVKACPYVQLYSVADLLTGPKNDPYLKP